MGVSPTKFIVLELSLKPETIEIINKLWSKYFKNMKGKRKCNNQAEALESIAEQSISIAIKTG